MGVCKDIVCCFIEFELEVIYIVMEGLFGFVVCCICVKWKLFFMISYYIKFFEYVNVCFGFILFFVGYVFMCWFYNVGGCMMVMMLFMCDDLIKCGFNNLMFWVCGVDIELFNLVKCMMNGEDVFVGLECLIWVNVGCVVVEKNIEIFLEIDLLGIKVIVGDGL